MGLDTTYLRLVELVFDSENGTGYVMDFSNRTFQEFIIEKINLDMYSDKYEIYGNSKMKRLKGILRLENNKVAGNLLLHLLKYKETNYADKVIPTSSPQFLKLLALANMLTGRKPMMKSKRDTIKPKTDYKATYRFDELLTKLNEVSSIKNVQERGYGFEKYLPTLFNEFHLQAKGSFKINLTLEQIDGSFVLDNETYLVEAKYTSKKISTNDLVIFNSKLRGYVRGLFVTFSELNMNYNSLHLRSDVKFICITVKDIIEVLFQKRNFDDFLRQRIRRFNETGEFYQE